MPNNRMQRSRRPGRFQVQSRHRLPGEPAQIELPQWSRHRVVLLGDAAYAVSLLAGQGASLAIAAAYMLAEQLATASSVQTALNHYERLWRPVAEEKQQVARNGICWFLPHSRAQLRARHR